jgi:hypothetical protein
MNLGIYVAYAVTIYCYFMVSVSGYWAFGNQVAGNVSGVAAWVVEWSFQALGEVLAYAAGMQ